MSTVEAYCRSSASFEDMQSFHAIVMSVAFTMILTAICITCLYTAESFIATQESMTNSYIVFDVSDDASIVERIGLSFANAFIIVFWIVVYQRISVLRAILRWFLASIMFDIAIDKYNVVSVDQFTYYLVLWNFALGFMGPRFVSPSSTSSDVPVMRIMKTCDLMGTSIVWTWRMVVLDPWTLWAVLMTLAIHDFVVTVCWPSFCRLRRRVCSSRTRTIPPNDDDMPRLVCANDEFGQHQTEAQRSVEKQPIIVTEDGTQSSSLLQRSTVLGPREQSSNKNHKTLSKETTMKKVASIVSSKSMSTTIATRTEVRSTQNQEEEEESLPLVAAGTTTTDDNDRSNVNVVRPELMEMEQNEIEMTCTKHSRDTTEQHVLQRYVRHMEEEEEGEVDDEERDEQFDTLILGLNDYCGYALLTSQAMMYSYTTFVACFVIILATLCTTFVVSTTTVCCRKQLLFPTLAVSIMLGMIVISITRQVIEPWFIQTVLIVPYYV